MHAQRLRRLSLLTQGVALITLAGCQKEGTTEPPHVNSPAPAPAPTPVTSAAPTTAPVVASATASAVAEPEPPTTNAPIHKAPKTNAPK